MALHGGVDGAHGEVALEIRRLNIGSGGEEAKKRDAERDQDDDDERDDNSEKEFSHEASEGIVADRRARALAVIGVLIEEPGGDRVARFEPGRWNALDR